VNYFPTQLAELEGRLFSSYALLEEREEQISDMIPKSQVAEMERLLNETVSRLSARVITLEKTRDSTSDKVSSENCSFRELPPIPSGHKAINSLRATNPRLLSSDSVSIPFGGQGFVLPDMQVSAPSSSSISTTSSGTSRLSAHAIPPPSGSANVVSVVKSSGIRGAGSSLW
jgi:hypothetical protein